MCELLEPKFKQVSILDFALQQISGIIVFALEPVTMAWKADVHDLAEHENALRG